MSKNDENAKKITKNAKNSEKVEKTAILGYNCEKMRKKEANMEKILCPVCGEYVFDEVGDYDICPICGWKNDKLQMKDPDFEGGANKMSLNQAIKAYMEGKEE